jgi:Protein of unknown function (DUF1091)
VILQTYFQLNGLKFCSTSGNFSFFIGMCKFDQNPVVQDSLRFSQNDVTATSDIYVTDIVAQGNPGLTNVTVSLKNVVDDQNLSINLTIFKRLNHQIMVNFKLSKMEGKAMKTIFQAPKFNYCDLRRHGVAMPIVTDLFKAVEVYGNLVFKCPAEPGVYSIKDMNVNKLPIMSLISTGVYVIATEMMDENRRSRPDLIMRFKAFFSRE